VRLLDEQRLLLLVLLPTSHARNDYDNIISMNKSIDLQANATVPAGATIRLTVEYRSKTKQISHFHFFQLNSD
jgi:hypothetical protein